MKLLALFTVVAVTSVTQALYPPTPVSYGHSYSTPHPYPQPYPHPYPYPKPYPYQPSSLYRPSSLHRGFQTQHSGYQPVRNIVNHRPYPVPVPVPYKVYNPVPVYREILNTVVNRVPVAVRVPRPVAVPVPVDIVKPVPVYRPVDVVKPVPVENHHLLVRKIGVPIGANSFHRSYYG